MNVLSIIKIFKNKSYNYLNVIGLAVAFGVFIIVSMYIYREFQGDKFHENYENIVRLNRGDKVGTPIPLSDYFKERFPEIENYCRLNRMYDPVIKNEDRFQKLKTGYFGDKSAFDIFTFEIINGNIGTDFSTPFSIGISENLAQKLFGYGNPIGKAVKFNNEFDFIVKAVFKNLPSNSHLNIDAIGSIESMKFMNEIYKTPYETFTRWSCMNYLLLAPNSSVTQVNEKLNSLIQELMNDEKFAFGIQPFNKIYFDSDSGMDECRHSSKQTLFILLTISCIIMILACVNYINLSTAQIYTRHKEIGIKKISGASKFMLISQFIKESVLISFLAMVVGFGLAYLFQFPISDLLPSDFNFINVFSPKPLIFYTTLSVIIGIIAGLYPAFYYSSAKEINILKGINSNAKNQGALRKGLIIVQFTASIVLIMGTLFVYKQLNFFKNTDPGFPKEQLMYVAYNEMALSPVTNSFVEEVSKNPNIKSVTQTSTIPGNVFYQNVNKIENEDKILYDLIVDDKYLATMGLNLIEGRMPSVNPEKRRNELVLNQTAVKYLGWDEPIGHTDIWGREVVGIVEDFNFMSMHQPIFPLMIRFDPFYFYATIKFNTQNTAQVLSDIGSKWNEFFPAGAFEYHFFDDSFQQLYEAEIKFGQMAVYLSFIALFISLLGMAGVVSFITKRKIKEIGVRKVNGARISEILAMLNKDFIKWVAIAFVVACPIAYYAMHKWIENFAYKTNLSWWIFALSGLLAFGIATLTVSWQSWKAATRNPIESLRYE